MFLDLHPSYCCNLCPRRISILVRYIHLERNLRTAHCRKYIRHHLDKKYRKQDEMFCGTRCLSNPSARDCTAMSLFDVECQIIDCISYLSSVITDFVLKFPNFRYHGNNGCSEEKVKHNVTMADIVRIAGS